MWIFANLMTDISNDLAFVDLWSKVTMIGPIFFSYFFYRLSLYFPKEKIQIKKKQHELVLTILTAIFLVLIPTRLNIRNVYIGGNGFPEIVAGPLYIFALAFFLYLIITALRNIFSGYKNFDSLQRRQVQYISFGLGFFVFLGSMTNAVLPVLGNSQLVNFGPYSIIIFIIFTSYAIIRFKMFDIKVVVTQLLVYTLWIFVLIRVLLSETAQDGYTNGVLLVLLVITGIFLIRSVLKEVETREKIELLATDLQKANDRLTELDRQKSEFVSFATHQLRAPLTAMKGYASLILEGDMGQVAPQAKDAVGRIFESTNTLTNIVDDYLNVTRIELGTMKYAFETMDLKTLIEDVIAELKPNIDKATGVKFIFGAEDIHGDYRITADRDKLKQVIANLIDNSIKYTPKGSVGVSLSFNRSKHKFIFMLKDTGIGIAPETLPHLFNKFTRAGNANKTNIKGTGLGLFVAKEIITAHHGVIRAESEGEGKGSTFIVELEPFAKV